MCDNKFTIYAYLTSLGAPSKRGFSHFPIRDVSWSLYMHNTLWLLNYYRLKMCIYIPLNPIMIGGFLGILVGVFYGYKFHVPLLLTTTNAPIKCRNIYFRGSKSVCNCARLLYSRGNDVMILWLLPCPVCFAAMVWVWCGVCFWLRNISTSS